MWTPNARARMQDAAKKANLEMVALGSESECALAYLIYQLTATTSSKPWDVDLDIDDNILIVDLGCGTGDFVTYKLKDKLTARSRLLDVQSTSGALCRSSAVSELLLTELNANESVKSHGGLHGVKVLLGDALGPMTDLQWRKKALRALEEVKLLYPMKRKYFGTVEGKGAFDLPFSFTKDVVEAAFNAVIKDIKMAMDAEVGANKPRIVYVTGGFGRNKYVMEAIQDRYQIGDTIVVRPIDNDSGESLPVSRGGLLRYIEISAQNLPSQYGYAVLQDERFDHAIHTDGITSESERVRRSRVDPKVLQTYTQRQTNRDIVLRSPYLRSVDIVEERLHISFDRGQLIMKDDEQAAFEQDYYLDAKEPTLTADFVYLEDDFKSHEPAKVNGVFRPKIKLFKMVTKRLTPERLDALGVKLTQKGSE